MRKPVGRTQGGPSSLDTASRRQCDTEQASLLAARLRFEDPARQPTKRPECRSLVASAGRRWRSREVTVQGA